MGVSATPVSMAVTEDFNYFQERKKNLIRRGETEKWQKNYKLQPVSKQWQNLTATGRYILENTPMAPTKISVFITNYKTGILVSVLWKVQSMTTTKI